MSITEIERMSTSERLQTMEALWDSLCREPEQVESPDWHGDVLDERRKRVESGETSFHSIEEAEKRLLG